MPKDNLFTYILTDEYENDYSVEDSLKDVVHELQDWLADGVEPDNIKLYKGMRLDWEEEISVHDLELALISRKIEKF